MAVTTSVSTSGENRVITITLSAPIAKADSLADDAARFYYNIFQKNEDEFKTNGEITPYNSLSTANKLKVLGLETQRHLLEGAKAYYKKSAIDTASETAETEADARYQ